MQALSRASQVGCRRIQQPGNYSIDTPGRCLTSAAAALDAMETASRVYRTHYSSSANTLSLLHNSCLKATAWKPLIRSRHMAAIEMCF